MLITMMTKELQRKAAQHAIDYDNLTGRKVPEVPAIMIHLTEELGELATEIYNEVSGRKALDIENVKDGVADIFILLSLLAKKYSIDLEKEVIDVMKKDMDKLRE